MDTKSLNLAVQLATPPAAALAFALGRAADFGTQVLVFSGLALFVAWALLAWAYFPPEATTAPTSATQNQPGHGGPYRNPPTGDPMGSKSTDWIEDDNGKSHYWNTEEAARLYQERDEREARARAEAQAPTTAAQDKAKIAELERRLAYLERRTGLR